jgi:hypothetical protein
MAAFLLGISTFIFFMVGLPFYFIIGNFFLLIEAIAILIDNLFGGF